MSFKSMASCFVALAWVDLSLPYQWHETRRALVGYSAKLPAAVVGAVGLVVLALLAVALACKVSRAAVGMVQVSLATPSPLGKAVGLRAGFCIPCTSLDRPNYRAPTSWLGAFSPALRV
eukprot:jgi/Chlat1/491/Chrsp103S00984